MSELNNRPGNTDEPEEFEADEQWEEPEWLAEDATLPEPTNVEYTAAILADNIRNNEVPWIEWLHRVIEAGPGMNRSAAASLVLATDDVDEITKVAPFVLGDWSRFQTDFEAFVADQVLECDNPSVETALESLRLNEDELYWPTIAEFAVGNDLQCEAACLALAADEDERAEQLLRSLAHERDLVTPFGALVDQAAWRDEVSMAYAAARLADEPSWPVGEKDLFLDHAAQNPGEDDEETVLDVAEDASFGQTVRELAFANALAYLMETDAEVEAKQKAKDMLGPLSGMLGSMVPGMFDPDEEAQQAAYRERIEKLVADGLVARGDFDAPSWFEGQVVSHEERDAADAEGPGVEGPAAEGPAAEDVEDPAADDSVPPSDKDA